MFLTPTTHDNAHLGARRLWWFVALSRVALALAIGALMAALMGIECIPSPISNPKFASSLFAGFRAIGAFGSWPLPLFELAGLLAVCSAVVRLWVRLAFRAKHE